MKTNYLSAPVIALNPSLVTIAAWDSRSPAIPQKETKRTKVRGVGFAFVLAALLGACVTTELRAQVVVVPNSLATNDGNGSATSTAGPASVRWLHIHDASEFGALSGPSFLTQFAYRPDRILDQSGPRSWTLRIYASTTSRSVADVSTTFAENLGTNNTLVFDGTVTVTTGNLPGRGNTRQFDYVFPFTTPFLYDPAAGNLALDLQIEASGSALTFDTVSGDPAIGRVFGAGSSTATTGDIRFSHVTQLTFEPPPKVGDTWVEKADMPTPRSRLSSSVVNGKIYAMGGTSVGVSDSMATVEVYNPDTDSWEAKADMPTSRAAFAAAAVNGKIYAIGGDSSWLASPMKIVEEYDPTTDTWIRKADMPTARSGIAAAVVDGTIYVVGGLTRFGAPPLKTVEAYDPATDTWEQKAAMTAPRGLTCAAAVDGKIFVIGSSQPPNGPWLSTAESYDPQTDAWTSIASITIARGALAGTTAHGRVYVMGGRDCCNAYQTLEEYDPVRNTWTTRASMESTSPINVAVSEVNGRIYAIGGSDFNSQGSSLVLEYTPPAAAQPNELSSQLLTNPDGSLSFYWNGAAGVHHQVEVSSDLLTWEPFGQPIVGAGNTQQVLQIVPGNKAEFLRVRALAVLDSSGFVLIPAGSFQMGDTFGEGESDELPVHTVDVPAFLLQARETTKAEWDEVRAWALENGYGFDNAGSGEAPDHPVHTVNWWDVVKWCNARSEKEGLTPCYYLDDAHTTVYRTGQVDLTNTMVDWEASGYRLPTEAEWEKAARGGLQGRRFPWGDTITHALANYYSASIYAYDMSATCCFHPDWNEPYTSPVESFPANGYGLFDMTGNVQEWCWDWLQGDYYANSPVAAPLGPDLNSNRVSRGGSWNYLAFGSRVAARHGFLPSDGYDDLGFRPARGQ